jgi:acyl-CoA thioester hydrolase
MNKNTVWTAEVRDYELDFQGIVNNACYFHYFDQARAKYFDGLGIDIQYCTHEKINIVLLKTEIAFKAPLKYKDVFYVESKLDRVSTIKFRFLQKIYLQKNKKLIAESESLVCAVNTRTQKPCLVKGLENFTIIDE